MMDGSPRYERPPVRSTSLTVFVEPIENFDVSMIGQLQQRWSERFPALAQTAPRRRPTPLPEVDIFGSGWPLPGVEQVSSSLCRTIAYQHDQIALDWTFDAEAPDTSYPGFEVLAGELNSYFDFFADLVERWGDRPLKVQGCRCQYGNLLDDIAGADWIANYLSDWHGVGSTRRFDDAGYLGFRLRREKKNEELGANTTTRVDIDSGRDVGATQLDIDTLSIPLPDSPLSEKDPKEVAQLLLTDAHQRLIEAFEESSNDAMRTTWGVRQ
ncbi:hypothetical protein M1247_12435 [Mycobacterium sp. 21AC1]|uniref:hypothetical protein n=1 Tax=[Mycobacterium] appelbergii TaxID=2939269 RepID=UPI0029393A5B|nr:hypothetical protein [Mycobacterium sp. 21AC1]MDV3125726.1 hypothetical protein [Mycobacterium sp. 21AC1]